MKINLLIACVSLITLSSCFPPDPDYNFIYDTIITDFPVNLEKINTEYDDYNSDLPYLAGRMTLVFSSNSPTSGESFDFVFKDIDISYHKKDDKLDFAFPSNSGNIFLEKLFPIVNTTADELGPYSWYEDSHDYFFYASNEDGNFDINFVYTPRLDWGTYDGLQRIYGPFIASSSSSEANDLYPTINFYDNTLMFCSDRENGTFSFYKIDLGNELPLYTFLTSSQEQIVEKDDLFSSEYNDKCLWISENLIVFTSDREGGFGGYDLYFSLRIDNQWTSPINFGDKINTEHDEYRPIAFTFAHLNVMIFSSNRPGGKGGFDLYAVIINDQLTEGFN
jgi:hypothetical protein